MNLITVDVTNVPKNLIYVGQEIDLISSETGFNGVSEFGIFNYEFIINFGYTKFREYIR
jgi:alanine racemase